MRRPRQGVEPPSCGSAWPEPLMQRVTLMAQNVSVVFATATLALTPTNNGMFPLPECLVTDSRFSPEDWQADYGRPRVVPESGRRRGLQLSCVSRRTRAREFLQKSTSARSGPSSHLSRLSADKLRHRNRDQFNDAVQARRPRGHFVRPGGGSARGLRTEIPA